MNERSVLMISYPFPPASLAGVYRTLRFVKYLPEHGWKPLVLAPDKEVFDPAWCDPALESAVPAGTVVERSKVYRPILAIENMAKSFRSWGSNAGNGGNANGKGPQHVATAELAAAQPEIPGQMKSFARDALNMLFASPDPQIGWFPTAVKSALKMIRRHRVQAIYSTGPPHSSHLIAVALKIMMGLPAVIDFRDPWSRGTWRYDGRGLIHRHLHPSLEGVCVRMANRVILNTTALLEEFRVAYPKQPPEKFVAIPNGFDPDLLAYGDDLFGNRLSSEKRAAIVCHPGTVYGKRDLRPVVAAVQKLVHAGQRVRFEQIGTVENECETRSYAESLGVQDSVLLHGSLPHGDTLRIMSSADVFLLSQPGTVLQIPGKIFEMLPFGRPIVALTDPAGATAKVIQEYDLGSVVQPFDSGAIATAISQKIGAARDFKANDGWRKAMQDFDGRELTKRLGEALDECLRKG
jgi:glycosyltransferase involved in cell wall biosynthesis